MPKEHDYKVAEIVRQTGLCTCTHPIAEHAETVEGLKEMPFHCALTRDEVLAYHTPGNL